MKEIIKVAEKLAELTKKQKKNIALGLSAPAAGAAGYLNYKNLKEYLRARAGYSTASKENEPIVERYGRIRSKVENWLEKNMKEYTDLENELHGKQKELGKILVQFAGKNKHQEIADMYKKYTPEINKHIQRLERLSDMRSKVLDALDVIKFRADLASGRIYHAARELAKAKRPSPLAPLAAIPALALLYYGLTNRKKKK